MPGFRRNKAIIILSAIVLSIYLTLNGLFQGFTYILTLPYQTSKTLPHLETNNKVPLPISLKSIVPGDDNNVQLIFNLDVNELFKSLDGYLSNNNGEATNNPLPPQINIVKHDPSICNEGLQWIICVHSAPGNVERRRLVRETWGNRYLFKDHRTRIVFLVGTPEDLAERKIIDEEFKRYGDMVQGDFVEHYKNLTLKAILGLKYVSKHCSHVKYTLKADDDAFVNIFELMQLTQKYTNDKKVVICPLWKANSMKILRDPKTCMKWCVRFDEFPGKSHFPPYCAGLGYTMSVPLITELHRKTMSTPLFWIDDVYVTGLLLGKVKKVNTVDILNRFTLKKDLFMQDYSQPKKKPSFVLAHMKNSTGFIDVWGKALRWLPKSEIEQLNSTVLDQFPSLRNITGL